MECVYRMTDAIVLVPELQRHVYRIMYVTSPWVAFKLAMLMTVNALVAVLRPLVLQLYCQRYCHVEELVNLVVVLLYVQI